MLVILLLGIHLALMLAYLICIDKGISRLDRTFLIPALFMPFIGELCLLAADTGKAPGKSVYETYLRNMFKGSDKTELVKDTVNTEDTDIDKLTSGELIRILGKNPSQPENLLKRAIKSHDPEVVHIAAAAMMHIEQQYEKKIKGYADIYERNPENMGALRDYIDIIGEYYGKHILEGESARLLIEQQKRLIERYLMVMPGDEKMIKELERYTEDENVQATES